VSKKTHHHNVNESIST